MGRPKKYTPKRLKAGVEDYFATITRESPVTELVDTGQVDKMGHKILKRVEVTNQKGERVMVREYLVPPTVEGLCAHLGIHRSTWADYCGREDMAEAAELARGRIRQWLEEQLITRKDVRGIIFSLQNNYGLAERREVELGREARRAMAAASIPMEEKEQLLRELAAEFGAPDGGAGEG